MRIGTHVSIAGGLENAPGNAKAVGAEIFQMFSRSPHGGPVKPIDGATSQKFKKEMSKCGIKACYIHAPYFINLASTNNRIYYGSISVLRQELERGSLLGVKAMMAHLGSFGQLSEKDGIKKIIDAIGKVLDGYKGSTKLLLEISAGAGNIAGDDFGEIKDIIHSKPLAKHKIGVCFDTCHAFASGYDLRNEAGVRSVMKKFDQNIGLENLAMVHANDSKGDLGERKDRHEHIGLGKIGLDGFAALAANKTLSKLDWILETPKDSPTSDPKNIKVLRSLGKK